jgi:hypothetical protein
LIPTGVLVFAGLVGTPGPFISAETREDTVTDPRLGLLKRYLANIKAPTHHLAEEFLAAADRHTLDWRLLPSIAVIESGAGKAYINNNIFGWDSGKKRFSTIEAGIHAVAERLRHSRLYRNKKVPELLNTYNPRPDYATRVMRVMRAIGPAEPIPVEN